MQRPIPYEMIPNGWYVVALTNEVPVGRVTEARYFDRELVIWRSASGKVSVQDAYCPHLGANLGDGRVVGEALRCPFHGFEFDSGGACVKTSYGKRPPQRARLASLPSLERDGMIFAWYHADDALPTWEPPAYAGEGLTGFRFSKYTFPGHPQETSENSSDLGHFATVHSYSSAELVGDAIVDRHILKARYRVLRSLDYIGLPNKRAALEFAAEVHGLGYSSVRAHQEIVGIDVRLVILASPIDASNIDLRIGVMMRSLPIPGLTRLIHPLLLRLLAHDVGQDIPLWSRKRYIERPPLADGDGPIATYRRYASQFYSKPRVSLSVVDESPAVTESESSVDRITAAE